MTLGAVRSTIFRPVVVTAATATLVAGSVVWAALRPLDVEISPRGGLELSETRDRGSGARGQAAGLLEAELRRGDRTAEAMGLALALATEAIAARLAGRVYPDVGSLVEAAGRKRLVPPGLTPLPQPGAFRSAAGTVAVRYRPDPIGVEVLSLATADPEGDALLARVAAESGAELFAAEGEVHLPDPFRPASELSSRGWIPEPTPAPRDAAEALARETRDARRVWGGATR